ncbi:hypothetical protein [Pseudonocardia spinosispora]|uniref:hypothetical protein n=1 Tax=Pseudonocardia spinosispora TaxID=103441 RepID=UPI0003FB5DE2|nr:hypothetical protein [Pseudonocardia spinosispora]
MVATVPVRLRTARLRTAVTSHETPNRLWRTAVLLVLACFATALVSTLVGWTKQDAVGVGGARLAALDTDTAQLYRSLNEADATASSGTVASTTSGSSAAMRARYDDHIARASQRLVHAAGLLPPGGRDAAEIVRIAAQLPRYTALVESGRGSGGPHALASASALLRTTILPAADRLRHAQAAALAANYRAASAVPVWVLVVMVGTLLGIGYVARAERRRTNRVLSPGLLVAAALVAIGLLWWLVASLVADIRLASAREHNEVAAALDNARVVTLQARASETLGLIDQGGSDQEYRAAMTRLLGPNGLLSTAVAKTGDDAPALAAVEVAAIDWQNAHRQLRALVDSGNLQGAKDSAIGADPQGSGPAFDRLNATLADALGIEQTALAIDVRRAETALSGITDGPALLALLAAVAAAFGVGRRAWEYR